MAEVHAQPVRPGLEREVGRGITDVDRRAVDVVHHEVAGRGIEASLRRAHVEVARCRIGEERIGREVALALDRLLAQRVGGRDHRRVVGTEVVAAVAPDDAVDDLDPRVRLQRDGVVERVGTVVARDRHVAQRRDRGRRVVAVDEQSGPAVDAAVVRMEEIAGERGHRTVVDERARAQRCGVVLRVDVALERRGHAGAVGERARAPAVAGHDADLVAAEQVAADRERPTGHVEPGAVITVCDVALDHVVLDEQRLTRGGQARAAIADVVAHRVADEARLAVVGGHPATDRRRRAVVLDRVVADDRLVRRRQIVGIDQEPALASADHEAVEDGVAGLEQRHDRARGGALHDARRIRARRREAGVVAADELQLLGHHLERRVRALGHEDVVAVGRRIDRRLDVVEGARG